MNQTTNALTVIQSSLTSESMQRQIGTLLPPSVNRDRFTEVTIAAIQNSPEVLDADRDSLYRACLASARRGLLPDKREGALVIFNTNVGTKDAPRWMKVVQFLPMVEGVIKEMAKAGIKAYAVSVFANDQIDLWNDDAGQHVSHKPNPFGDRGQLVGVFASAMTADGRPYVEPLAMEDIYRVAGRSKQCTKDREGKVILGGTWKSDFERMAQKSALHRVRKRLPITDEDAIQNLRDMEESSDIDLAESPIAATASQVTPSEGSATPPPAQIEAPKESTADEVLKPTTTKRNRSRVLAGVVAQQKQQAEKVDAPKNNAPANGSVRPEPTAGAGVHGNKAVDPGRTGQPPPPASDYTEDDIV